jgi:hypothetical protein
MPPASASGRKSPLAAASVRLLRAYMDATGTFWWSMVRRRSTVRFRKGAPQVRGVFRYRTADLLWGYSSGRNRSAARLDGGVGTKPQAPGGLWTAIRIGGGVPRGHFGGQDRSSR